MEREKFIEFLTTKGLKLTKERSEILAEVLSMKKHFDPEELFINLRSKGSKVSRASVYRTISLLLESGIIEEVERIDRHAHYEKITSNEHHDHMICLKCGKVIEFFSPTLEMLQNEICEKEEFKCLKHSLEIHGYCKDCSIEEQ